jgi:hypothetical protein
VYSAGLGEVLRCWHCAAVVARVVRTPTDVRPDLRGARAWRIGLWLPERAEPEHQDYLERCPNGYTCNFVRPGWRLPKRPEAAARQDGAAG